MDEDTPTLLTEDSSERQGRSHRVETVLCALGPSRTPRGRASELARPWPAGGGGGPGQDLAQRASRHVPPGWFPYGLSWWGPLHLLLSAASPLTSGWLTVHVP